jgi:hypothetical protein
VLNVFVDSTHGSSLLVGLARNFLIRFRIGDIHVAERLESLTMLRYSS